MRTKTKILTASIMAAGVASSMAQSNVYSLNIVGYVNVPFVAHKQYLLNNPFDDGAGDQLPNVLQSVNANSTAMSGTTVFTFAPGSGYSSSTYSSTGPTTGVWSANPSLQPGTGFWFLPSGSGTLTFTGSVVLTNSVTLPHNGTANSVTLIGSAYPASTNLVGLGINWITNAGGGAAQSGDTIFRWDPIGGGYNSYTYSAGAGWSGGNLSGPTINVAEGFWYENVNAQDDVWSQTFTVN